jgi:hypothetical protein
MSLKDEGEDLSHTRFRRKPGEGVGLWDFSERQSVGPCQGRSASLTARFAIGYTQLFEPPHHAR